MNIDDIQGSKIVIAGSMPASQDALTVYLQSYGLTVELVTGEEHMLRDISQHHPDLIILDMYMSDVAGFDMCRQLKGREETRDIPVIFMSDQTEAIDTVKGFEAGAVDFMIRPLKQKEVLVRISAHLRVRNLQKTLQEKNLQLQQEIKNRQVIEEALRESEERFRVLAEASFEGIIVHDKGNILDVNHVLEEMFGYSRAELIGQNALDLMMAELQDGILSNVRTDYENLTEAEGIRKDGTVFPVELQAKAMPHQGKSVRVTAIRDVTWRKQAEEALIASERYSRNVIDSSLDMIITVNTNREIVEFNTAAQKTFGYSLDEAVGHKVDMLYAARQQSEDIHHSMLKKGQIIREVINRRKNGEEFPCLLSASTMYDVQGNVVGYMGLSRDITESKRAQSELLTAHNELKEKNWQLRELNASKDKFFSIISHDLKNPFSILLGFSELLAANIERYDRERIQSLANRMHTSAERLYALLENLLTWSKIQRGLMECAPETTDISMFVDENIDLLSAQAEKKQIHLEGQVPQGSMVYADLGMVNTVLRNLISNALKFTSAGGQVRVVSHIHEPDMIELVVSDTGVGIPEEIIPKLLRIDTQYTNIGTAGEEGTGLGLILCKELVEQNGGHIWIESKVGQGSAFHFTLPLRKQAKQ